MGIFNLDESPTIEQQALALIAENEALKCQVNELRGFISVHQKCFFDTVERDGVTIKPKVEAYKSLAKTSNQCIKSIKADAISDMCDKMPSSGFTKMRDQNNWIGDYIEELRAHND